MFFFVREILRSTSARHRGQRKIGITGISIYEVAQELEVDMELDSRPPGAEGDLNASVHGPWSCSRRLRPPQQSSHRRRRSPSTPSSRSPAPSSPTGVAADLCAWSPPTPSPARLISAHRCELRGRAPPLLQHTPPPATVLYWVPQAVANGSLLGPTSNGLVN